MADSQSAAIWYVRYIPRNGKQEPIDVSRDIRAMSILDHESKKDKVEIKLDNHLLDKFDNPVWERGNTLRVTFGHPDRLSPIRDYKITKIKGGRVLSVTAVGLAEELETKQHRRVFDNVTRSDVVKKIASELGYNTEFIEDTEEVYESISQANLSNAQMLRKLAKREGFQFFIDHTGLHWHERDLSTAPIREFIYHVHPGKGDIMDWNVENDISRKPGKVTVKGRNPKTKRNFEVEVSNNTDVNRHVLAPIIGNIDGETGKYILGVDDVVESEYQSAEEAKKEAKKKFRANQQKAVKLKLVIRGDAQVLAKQIVKVSNFSKRLSGLYYVQSAGHTLDPSSGFKTTLHMITDGFQKKKKGGSGSSTTRALTSCLSEIKKLGLKLDTASVDDRSMKASLGILSETISELLQKPEGSRGPLAAKATNFAVSGRSLAKKSGNDDAYNVLGLCIGVLQQVKESPDESPEASGKKNNQDVSDSRNVEIQSKLDDETGNLFISILGDE